MKITLTIVHYWNPEGGGLHQSLRPNPKPRIEALQSQLLCLRRLGQNQSVLHMADRAVYRTNDTFRNSIDIKIVTDGLHHVLDMLHPAFHDLYTHVITSPQDPKALGFEAHSILQNSLSDNYDLYGYIEDDLLVYDPLFFSKILWFTQVMGEECLLLPNRFELSPLPHHVDRFYIDGPIAESDLRSLVPLSGPVRQFDFCGFKVPFAPPANPHSGCFFLSHAQLDFWSNHVSWNDGDMSFISPLESAATLGISKAFQLFKPCLSHASWLEIQHFGTSFHELIPNSSV